MEKTGDLPRKEESTRTGKSSFLALVLLFQLLTNLVILFDIGYLRQILGFVCLTFVPGFVILKIFRWDEESLVETIIFSAGLSVAFIMFLGLILNELLPVFGVATPLASLFLLVALDIVVVLPCLRSLIRSAGITRNSFPLSYRSLVFLAIPALSVSGVLMVNNEGSNFLLLLMLVTIAATMGLGMFFRKLLPAKFYSIALLAVTVSLLLHSSLFTNYIVGWDIHSEYNVFKLTDNASMWNSNLLSYDDRISKGNSMLSVTILPTVYSKILNLDGTWVFKIVYPVLLALMPLVLYKLYSARMKKEIAFLSVFFLVSNLVFFEVAGFPAKQMIAELFYVLLFYVLLKEPMGAFKRGFLTVFFGASLVVSHYSLSYIFIFLVFLTWLLPIVARYFVPYARRTTKISLSTILLLFAFSFAWYLFTSVAAPFEAITGVGEQVSRTFFVDFFNPLARTPTALSGVPGLGQASSLWHQFGQILFYTTEFFIVVGIVHMVWKKKGKNFGQDYAMLSYLNLGILIMGIVMPNFARYFRMERFYQISLLFLAPFCVIGGETIMSFVMSKLPGLKMSRVKSLAAVTVVLILFFFFETGFLYEITGDTSYSLPLSGYRMNKVSLSDQTVNENEVAGAQWLSNQFNYSESVVLGDYISAYHVLTSYGLISGDNFEVLSNTTEFTKDGTYVYLRGVNLAQGTMVSLRVYWNLSEISNELEQQNLIYSNGGCEIFRVIGTEP